MNPSHTSLPVIPPAYSTYRQQFGHGKIEHINLAILQCDFIPRMLYPFPPPNPPEISALAFATNVLLLIPVLAAAFGAFRGTERRKWRSVLRNWGIAVALVAAVCGIGMASEEIRTYMRWYFLLVWLVVGPVSAISVVVQARGRRPTLRFVFGWLAATSLIVLLFSPAISIAKQAARRVQCQNNLRNLGLHCLALRKEPIEAPIKTSDGDPPVSWRTRVYGTRDYDSEPVLPPFDLAKPWNHAANLPLASVRAAAFVCPANFNPVDEMHRYYTAYAAVTGPKTAFPDREALPIEKFTDGTSNTIIYGEAPGLKIVWTEPRDIDISREPVAINLPGTKRGESPGTLSSYHAGGAGVVFADGHVRFLSNSIKPEVLKALLTATGGESLADKDY